MLPDMARQAKRQPDYEIRDLTPGGPSPPFSSREAPATRVGGMVAAALSNPWLVLGVALQATFFAMYLTLLSRADVSQVLPMTALDYVVVALLARLLIDEVITPARWGGIVLIIVGVLLVSRT